MPLSLELRQIVALLLVATLVPAPGLAWSMPVRGAVAPRFGGAHAERVFHRALNSTEQLVMSGPGRPQLYLLFTVSVPVPPATPFLNAGSNAWMQDFFGELMKLPATNTTVAGTTAEPPDSILDQMDAANADVLAMTTARRLASVPGILPFEANPNDGVPVSRSIGVAIEGALQQAGFRADGSSRVDNTTGAVTYEDSLPDGDIVVTGQLVNGEIRLTREFKPLTGSGDVGDPVRMATTAGPGTAVATTAPTTQTSTTNTGASPATMPAGARPIPADVVRAWGQELYDQFSKEAQQVTGQRDSQGRLLDMNGQVIAPTTVAALKLVQDAVVTDLQTFTQHLQELQSLSREQKVALGKDLADASQQLRTAAAQLDAAKAAYEPFLASESLYNNSMTRAAQLEAAGNTVGAAAMVAQAEATPYGRFVAARARYVQLLNANPLLGVKRDGTFLYEAFADNTLFPTTGAATATSIASDQRYVDLLNGFLSAGIEQTKQQATELAGYRSIEQLAVFASPAYAYVHDRIVTMGTMIGSTVTADMMAELRAASQGSLKSWTDVAWQKIVDRSLIVLQIGCVFLPGGPLIALALASAQIARAGKDTVVAYVDQQNAQQRAAATGFERVIQTTDDLTAASTNLLWTSAGSLFDVYGAMQYARLMRAMQAERQALNAAGTAPRPTTSTAQGPPSAFRDDPALPEVRNAAGNVVGARMSRLSQAELDAGDLDDLAELKTIYDGNLAAARAAGVPELRIQKIIGDGTPTADAADDLYRETLLAEHKVNISLDEYRTAAGIDVRNRSGNLTEDDYQWLRERLAQDPTYLDNLPNRGRFPGADDLRDGFSPVVTAEGRDALLTNPRVAQMVDAAKANAAAGQAADAAGTVVIPAGSTSATRPPVTGLADDTGTVIIPGARPAVGTQTTRMDPNRTALVDNADTTPTVRLDSADTTPTVRLDPADATPTVRLDPPDATPTARLDPADATPTLRLGADAPSPTVQPGPGATIPTVRTDPGATAKMADEVISSLPKAAASGMTPQQFARSVQSTMTTFGVGPQELVTALTQRLTTPRVVALTALGPAAESTSTTGVRVSIEALGVSSGTAFNITATNAGATPAQLQGEGIVIEPVRVPSGDNAAVSAPRADTPATTQPVDGFCLERLRPVAVAGTEYRLASRGVQAQHGGLVDVLHAAQQVMSAGGLRPDSEIRGYFNFIRQWSIWTRQERFDERTFTDEFLNQTKKNVEGQGVRWTNDMQNTVRKVAPGRWNDIQAILEEANKPKTQTDRGELPSRLPGSSSHLNGAAATPVAVRFAAVAMRRARWLPSRFEEVI